MRRRPFLAGLLPAALAMRQDAFAAAASAASADTSPAAPNPPLGVSHRMLRFPADHGSHPDTHVEWWYITGWLRSGDAAAANTTALRNSA